MADFSLDYDPGFVIYGLALNVFGQAWDGSMFVDPEGMRPDLAIPMAWDGTRYVGEIPLSLPIGVWLFRAYLQLDIIPDDPDPVAGMGYLTYGGDPDAIGIGFRAALAGRLASDTILQSLTAGNIYPQEIPERCTHAAVVWRVNSIARDHDLDGPTGLSTASIQLEALGTDAVEVDRIGQRLRQVFDGFEGTLGGTVEVDETGADDEGDDYSDPIDASDDGTYRIALDYTMLFRESPANRTE